MTAAFEHDTLLFRHGHCWQATRRKVTSCVLMVTCCTSLALPFTASQVNQVELAHTDVTSAFACCSSDSSIPNKAKQDWQA